MGQTERFLALRAQDTKTRTLAVTEFSRPLLVEAGAGTGKTALLVARILAWSLGPGWEQAEAEAGGSAQDIAGRVASGVVAITFTEKPAAEMGTRLAEGLATVLAGKLPHGLELAQLPEPEVCRERSRALLSVLDRYVLCTIHAFGLRLLARYPLEAGLAPGFQVDAEGFGVSRVVEDVVADFLANPDSSLMAPWQVLGLRQIGPEELTEALVAAVQQGVSPEAVGKFPLEEQLEWLTRELKEKLGKLAQTIAPLAQEKRLKKAGELWELASTCASHTGSSEEFLRQVVAELEAKGVLAKLNDWGRGKFAQTEVSVLAENAAAVQMLSLWLVGLWKAARLSEPQTLRAFLLLGESFLAEIYRRLREAGLVTYQDLLTGSVRLLSEHPHIARRERTRIKQLLVDEFQDTDRWQGRLVSLLALADEDPRPGLFLVGDPKQSIYGWRSADLAVYDGFKEKVKKAGGEVCPLVVNFRSVPVILDEVERAVRPVMQEEPGMQPAFQELVPFRSRPEDTGFGEGKHRPVEYWVCWEFDGGIANRKTRMADSRELEANALAHHIFELHELYGVSYSHMAVLLRAFSDADVYLEAMRQHGIPYATTHDPTYFQRREVLDAFCLLQAVADPEDELALLGFLRSAWAGIPDAAWWELKKRGVFPLVRELFGVDGERLSQLRRMIAEVAQGLSTLMPGRDRIRGWEQSALWALLCLGVLRQSFHHDPADVFVARVQSWLLPEATEAARFPGRVRVANLERFFRFVLSGLPSFPTPKELVQALRRAVEEAQREGGSRPPEADEAVLVTTIHQAKGLDFPFVFLADVARGSRGNRGPVAGAWWLGSGESSADLVLKVGKLATPNIVHLWAWQEQVAQAEAVRLLYVALTRAKERLVVSGHWPEQPPSQALVSLLSHRENLPDLENLAAKLDGNDRVEAGGALWVFPGAVRLPEVKAQKKLAAALPVEEIKQHVMRLEKEQQQAQLRQQLPLGQAVSAEAHEELRELLAAGEEKPLAGHNAATVAGTVVHRVLQAWDFGRDKDQELERQLQLLATYAPVDADPQEVTAGVERARALLTRFRASPLFLEFCALGDRVLGREVPVLLAGDSTKVAGFYTGAIDLVYRDNGQVVVADFKTDAVEGEELMARARAYRSQGALYARAVAQALELEHPPRFELWFLWSGQKVVFREEELFLEETAGKP